jgi:PAS domain-containing protein
VAFEIYDGLKVDNNKKLYSTPTFSLTADQQKITFRTLQTIYFSGHPWIIMYSNSPSFVRNPIYTRLSYGLLAIGFAVSSLLFFMVYTVTGSRKRAILYAEKMNRKLIKNVAELENTKQEVISSLEDVETQKNKLFQTATRLNLATKSARIGIWDWDLARNVATWDDQMYELYGMKRGDFS